MKGLTVKSMFLVAVLVVSGLFAIGAVSQKPNRENQMNLDLGNDDSCTDPAWMSLLMHIDQFHMENMESAQLDNGNALNDIYGILNGNLIDRTDFMDDFLNSCLEYQPESCIWDSSVNNTDVDILDHTYTGILRFDIDGRGWADLSFQDENIPFSINRNLTFTTYLNVSGFEDGNLSFGMGEDFQFIYRYEWGPNLTVQFNGMYYDTDIGFDTNWHVFHVITNPDRVGFFVDSNLILEFTNDIPMNDLWPNYHMESYWSGATLNIDYIHISQNRY